MNNMKIAFIALVLSIMTGCAGMVDTVAYQERNVQYKCQDTAKRNAINAFVRKESDVRFAKSQREADRALANYKKKVERIEANYDSCLASGYKRIFEENLRNQMSYRYR